MWYGVMENGPTNWCASLQDLTLVQGRGWDGMSYCGNLASAAPGVSVDRTLEFPGRYQRQRDLSKLMI